MAEDRGTATESVAQALEDLLPESFEWEETVRSYPWPAMLLAAVGGFVLGRTQGPRILESLSGFAARQVVGQVNSTLGDEIL